MPLSISTVRRSLVLFLI